MKYARVENGTVKEIIDFDPKGRFAKQIEDQFVKCTEDTKQNDIYEDGVFTTPLPKVPTQEELNRNTIAELNSTNDQLFNLIEDIAEFVEGLGFKIPLGQKKLIEKRKVIRGRLVE